MAETEATMTIRRFTLALGVALAAGCAAQQQVGVSSEHPANPAAAQAPVPPRSETLAIERTGRREAGAPSAAAAEHHHEHGAAAIYTCPHHPEVQSDRPGECPKCHMKLRPKPAASPEPTPAPGRPAQPGSTRDGHGRHGGHR
jgi:hypothetical protein